MKASDRLVPATRWTSAQVAAIRPARAQTIPLVGMLAPPAVAGLDLWDLWPLQNADGTTVDLHGWTLWFVLSAPALADPDERHDVARIRLMSRRIAADGAPQWRDHGNALSDGLCPGSREWAGSALYDPRGGIVTLFYTASGYRGEARRSFAQRLFQTTGRLEVSGEAIGITGWAQPIESFAADDHHYLRVTQTEGAPGFIKGFRDPAHFRDPVTGETFLLFTASLAQSTSDWNGCIGAARARDAALTDWEVLPPLITADGLNNEQERPHIIHRDGLYYLFWSTQTKVFAPGGPAGPTGLYAMVAEAVGGPWTPVNGTGLVAANPAAAPFQTYSWWVCDDLTVAGFADYPGIGAGEVEDTPAWRRAHFGAAPAPLFRIALAGHDAWVV